MSNRSCWKVSLHHNYFEFHYFYPGHKWNFWSAGISKISLAITWYTDLLSTRIMLYPVIFVLGLKQLFFQASVANLRIREIFNNHCSSIQHQSTQRRIICRRKQTLHIGTRKTWGKSKNLRKKKNFVCFKMDESVNTGRRILLIL